MIRLRKQFEAARFREMMLELPSTLSHLGSDDERCEAEFFHFLGAEQYGEYLTEIVETLESGRDPGTFWAKWIEVVVERTPPPESDAHQ
jgi:hypothetical protein